VSLCVFRAPLHSRSVSHAAQIITILVARVFGWIFKKNWSALSNWEIIAGIVLGPSLLGLYFPEFSGVLFLRHPWEFEIFESDWVNPLCLFIGMELDLKVLKNKANEAVVISHASIVIPFALELAGVLCVQSVCPRGVKFLSFSLFMGLL
jgi:Kef-type K+ transport system membrane component KefB